MFNKIDEVFEGKNSIGIAGHINPDGDAIGSCLSIYNYITKNYPKIKAVPFFENIPDKYRFIKGTDKVVSDDTKDFEFDLFISVDCADKERLGFAAKYFDSAKETICIDHHVSNEGYADTNIIEPKASSACEVIAGLLVEEKLDLDIATALYTGIVTDSGVFKYNQTSRKTMEIAGMLMDFGIDCGQIIDGTFYSKTYAQNQIMGRILLESMLIMDGKCIVGYCTPRLMDFYNVTKEDMDGIVEQLRLTKGVEVAIFLYGSEENKYKVSLRSKAVVDVSVIAQKFGGGGHIRAAGFNMEGRLHDIINSVTEQIEKQLKEV